MHVQDVYISVLVVSIASLLAGECVEIAYVLLPVSELRALFKKNATETQ